MVGKRQVFSVGDLGVDILQEISHSVEFGEEHSLKELDFSIGGNAANFAVIGSKLGINPVLLAAIGKDFSTKFLKKELAKAKVPSKLIKSGKPNAFSIILVNKRGERSIQSVKNCLSEITSSRVAKALLSKLKAGDIVFFGGFYHLQKFRPGFGRLLVQIKKRKALVCFDTCFDTYNVWNISEFLPLIDFLFVNDIELKHIAKGNTMAKRVDFLFRKGATCVAVKQSSTGSTLFVNGLKPKTFSSVAGKVVDTTGAGDAFNAGFVFGLVNDWSLFNCMIAGNFVAGQKIKVHGLAAPSASAVKKFVAKRASLPVIVTKSHEEMSREAAQAVLDILSSKPNASFALPTGSTPKRLYSLLTNAYKNGKADFSRASFFSLDEYVGLSPEDKNSFSFFLMSRFLGKVNARKKNIRLLNGSAKKPGLECGKHEKAIQRKGIDLCLLGIGQNGHIAFNEPGSSFTSRTRVIKLKQSTRKVNGVSFKSGLAPERAMTVGIKTILESDAILMLASGKQKKNAVSCMLKKTKSLNCPAASLQRHLNALVLADKAAV